MISQRNQTEFLEKVLYILKQNGIKKIKDLTSDTIYYRELFDGREHTNQRGADFAQNLYYMVQSNFERTRSSLNESNNNYVVAHSSDDEAGKYMCFFPSSSVILTKGISFDERPNHSWDTGYSYTIPRDFLAALLKYEKFIRAGILAVLPENITSSIRREVLHDNRTEKISTLSDDIIEDVNPRKGAIKEVNIIGKKGLYIDRDIVEELFFIFPWLYGAREEDYLEISLKNALFFQRYCNTISKFIQTVKTGEITNIFQDIKEAHIDMQIEFEKAKEQLNRKGVITVVGLACTFIPFFLPLPEELKTTLRAILGTMTVKELLSFFDKEKSQLKSIGLSSPYWITWQWEKKSSK